MTGKFLFSDMTHKLSYQVCLFTQGNLGVLEEYEGMEALDEQKEGYLFSFQRIGIARQIQRIWLSFLSISTSDSLCAWGLVLGFPGWETV
jgi:hypothetical protein